MILRKLTIFGFKSFADKTELQFGTGMTAVIGPNGCGKSNVVDAIRWVFGEQKASTLRSNSMQDVIFSGTQNRQPLNFAEVTLNIENNDGVLPVEYRDVSITRRVFRNGDSEYRLNKTPCRLRDIHDLFRDTGVGSSAYTTIENTMINSILSDKAEERRVLFEEASGIGKYKTRRKDSLRQLEKTKQDLLRINDKVQEADRQVRMLARHVEKARRYKSYFEDLKTLEISYENRRYVDLVEVLKKRNETLAELESKRETLHAQISTAESRIEKMQLTVLEKENELAIASQNVSDSDAKIAKSDLDISVNNERLKNLNQNLIRFDQDVQTIESQIEQSINFRTQIEKSTIERETQLQKSQERVNGASDELDRFDQTMKLQRDKADQFGRDQIDLINNLGESRNVLNTFKTEMNNAIDQQERGNRELENLEVRYEEYQEAIEKCNQQLLIVDEENRNLMQSREVLLARIEKEDKRYQKLLEQEKHLEAQISSNKSQLKFLAGLESAYEGYESGVKELLKLKLPGARGIIADLISVSDESMVGIVEKILGTTIQTVVFDTEEQLRNAVELLKQQQVGEASMVSLERLAALPQSNVNTGSQDGICLRSIVNVSQGCEVLADRLLGDIFITDNSDEALQKSFSSISGKLFASRDGVICRNNGTVIAGKSKKEKAGILQRKQQIEKLTLDIVRDEEQYTAIISEKDGCIVNRDEAKVELIEVDGKLSLGQRQQQEQQTNIRHYEKETQDTLTRIQALNPELANIASKISDLEQKISHHEAEVETFESRRDSLEEQVEASRQEVRNMEEERKVLVEHLKNIELDVHGHKNRIAQDKKDIERLTKEVKDLSGRKEEKMQEKQKAITEIADIEVRLESLNKELEKQREERAGVEAIRDSIREQYNGQLNEIEEVRKEAKIGGADLSEVLNRVHDQEIKKTREEDKLRSIREKIWQAYEIDLESPNEPLPILDTEDSEAVQNISMLKERIKRVGPVNMSALEDYETESQRLKEFTIQRDDLQTAVDDLEKAIKKLDKEARVQFIATFEQVQKNFTEMFTTLFEGGEAHIELEENVDPLEAPIHINVRPAGKKMRGVQLLSGGERALTAISLLFALYLVKPSAYCILDELDAPLDDANIGRFVKVLRKFAERTQFIVITHNKRTMEAADLLYGVTQQEKGISTIVSVKFDDAELQAA